MTRTGAADPAPHQGRAYARVALAGNPSDLFGGAVLAVTLPVGQARAAVSPSSGVPGGPAIAPASDLVHATVRRFARERGSSEAHESTVAWETTIPERVGLGGSSAIVIAVTRALCARCRVSLVPGHLAAFALAVETQELGIAAGLQDRVVQAYEGLVFMDFAALRYERLAASRLPPLVVAWRSDAAASSGAVHAKDARREDKLHSAVAALADAARAARDALIAGDAQRLARCVDASFDARAEMMTLDARHVAMIETARRAGAAANYTGSGGAIVAVCRDERHRVEVSEALAQSGCRVWPSAPSRWPAPAEDANAPRGLARRGSHS